MIAMMILTDWLSFLELSVPLFFLFGSFILWHIATRILLKSVEFSYTPQTEFVLRMFVGALCALFPAVCPPLYFKSYFIFLCASCLVIYTDWLSMLIARMTSLYVVPLGWFLAYHNYLAVSFLDSVGGTLLAIAVLAGMQKLSEWRYGQAGLGTGDIDYLALAGAFLGMQGAWLTLLCGSFLGSLYALTLFFLKKLTRTTPFAFGSFLAFAGIVVLLFKYQIATFLI